MRPKLHKIKHWVIEKTLGKGTYGTVKLAYHEQTKEKVAIKIIKKKVLAKEDLDRIHRELHILTLLNHPNIIKLHEVIDRQKITCIVMEYCGGGDLRKYVKAQPKGRLPIPQALTFFRQILCGLSYCHQHFVIHRDVCCFFFSFLCFFIFFIFFLLLIIFN